MEAQYKECPDGNLWRNVAKLIQAEFRDENLEEETVWKSVVFLSKRGGYLHSISLVRVIWKTIDITMDHQLGESMVFHDVIPKFQSNHGTGTASIKEKLLHKIAVMCKGVMYDIFLYHHKYYNKINRWWCLNMLEGCGVLPRTLRLIQQYW